VDGLAPDGSTRVTIDSDVNIDSTGNGSQTESVTLPDGVVAEAVITYATLPGQTATGGTVTMTRNDFVTNADAAGVLQNLYTDVQDADTGSSLATQSEGDSRSAGSRPVTADDLVVGGGPLLSCSACRPILQNVQKAQVAAYQDCALTAIYGTVTVACGAGTAATSAAQQWWLTGFTGTCTALAGAGTYDELKSCIAGVQNAFALNDSQASYCYSMRSTCGH
jgi:hypothetical protein